MVENPIAMVRFLNRFSIRTYCLAVTGLLALAGAAMAIYTSVNGPWGDQDAASYIITARNIMRGIGLGYYLPDGRFIVLTIRPPLYSAALGAIGLLGVNLVDAARWLNVLLFAATILMGGLIFIRHSSAPELSIPAAMLLVIFPNMVRMYSSSLSEPLFVFLLLASAFCLISYFKYNTRLWLLFSALTTGLLPMIRYIGIALIPVGVLSIFLFLPSPWKERIKKAIAFGIGASLPFLVWEAWVYFQVDHSLAGRGFQLDWGGISGRFIQFYSAVTQYVLSWLPFGGYIWEMRFRYRYAMIFLIIVVIIVVTLLAARRTRRGVVQARNDGDVQIFAVFGLWLVVYIFFLAITGLFLTPNPPITNRILLPFYAGLVLGFTGALACWQNAWFRGKWRWLKILPWAIGLWGVAWYTPTTMHEVMLPLHASSAGVTAYTWKNSETMAAVRRLPKDTVIVSTDSYAIWVWADRPAYEVVENIQPAFISRDTPYGSDNSDLAQAAFQKEGSVLVIFDNDLAQQLLDVYGGAYGDQAQARAASILAGLTVVGKYPDGAIYSYPK